MNIQICYRHGYKCPFDIDQQSINHYLRRVLVFPTTCVCQESVKHK
jgi:hypothetical protein